jgi:uncharacterized protein YegP (UPF0339 family)
VNNLYFDIYISDKDLKYYWRLISITNSILPIPRIIATGHQAYKSKEEAIKDIEKVKDAIRTTPIR